MPVRSKIICFLLFLFSANFALAQNDLPADKNATPQTIHLYQNLRRILEKGFLFGHQDDLAYGVGWKLIPGKSDVKEVTGDYPAIYGWELGRLEIDKPVNLDSVPFDKMKQLIGQGYERGGVITISWHFNNPLTGKTAWDPAPGTVASILPGGEKHGLYKQWLDKIALFLSGLKDVHGEPIPVILRPFHELNGDWFWWGGKNCTAAEFKQLWQFTIGYLRDERNLHNLLYAYNTDRFASEEAYLEKYPGDEWVDITGFDIYQAYAIIKNESFSTELDKTLGLLEDIAKKRNKIPALTEFGYNSIPDSSWWTHTFLKAIGSHKIAYALAWRNSGSKNKTDWDYYVPYRGQASAKDFVQFYNAPRTLFQKDATLAKLYQ